MVRRGLVLSTVIAVLGFSGDVFAQTPPSQTDLAYTAITPCRLLDTRVAGGTLAAGQARAFHVKGANLSGQGGSSTGCGVGSTATGAIINFVATVPSGTGYLRAWAYPAAAPLAAVLNYGVVSGLSAIANGIAVPLCDAALN